MVDAWAGQMDAWRADQSGALLVVETVHQWAASMVDLLAGEMAAWRADSLAAEKAAQRAAQKAARRAAMTVGMKVGLLVGLLVESKASLQVGVLEN